MRARPFLRLTGLIVFLVLSTGCSRTSQTPAPAPRPEAEGPRRQVEVHVQGTAGVPFEGSLGEPGATRSIRGQVPARFSAQVRQDVFVRVQKAGREGRITVRVVVDGQEVAARATDRPYGLVTMHYPPAPSDR
jgi:hypothetical protein